MSSSERKPVSQITDRAKRYRAVRVLNSLKREKRCFRCGSKRFLVPDHKDGNESNNVPSNLRWACKSCNTLLGKRMAKAGRGVRTRQYNPGATNLAQYVQAAMEHVRGSHDAAGKVLHETPKAVRREFAREIWFRRGYRGNPPQDIMPEFWAGKLKDSHGRTVTDLAQAKAILLSELRALGKIPARKNPTFKEAERYLLYDHAREWANATPAERKKIAKKAAEMRRIVARENPRSRLTPAKAKTVFDREQFKIAVKTLRMPDEMVDVMGGMTKPQAREIVARFTPTPRGRHAHNPRDWRVGDLVTFHGFDGKDYNGKVSRFSHGVATVQYYVPGSAAARQGEDVVSYLERKDFGRISRRNPYEGSGECKVCHALVAKSALQKGACGQCREMLKKSKQNPDGSPADALYRKFHGRGPDKIYEMQVAGIDPYGGHPELTSLGPLIRFIVGEGVVLGGQFGDEVREAEWVREISFVPSVNRWHEWLERTDPPLAEVKAKLREYKAPDLAAVPNTRQLYIVGGNQNLDSMLRDLGADPEKDLLDLGNCYLIEYFTQKRFDHFDPINYFHALGEKTHVQPRLLYDRVHHLLSLAGGEYVVTARGIEN